MANDKELAEEDARAMVLVFRVLLKLSAVLKAGRKTKKDLGIRIIMTLFQTNLVETEPGSGKMEAVPFDKEVLIPVFKDTTEGFQYTTEVLPPYAERAYNPPKSFEDPVFTKLLEHEKKGDYDADFIHLPKMIDGDPSYYPETLVLINREDPDHVHVFAYPGPFIEDTDRFLIDAAYQMLDENTVPQRIRYRSSAVKTVLKPLFDRVGIKTRKVQHLDTIDFFLEQFDRFREDSSSANRAGQTRPGPAKTESEKTFSVFEIAKMEVEPVYKLAEYSKEDLAALLIRRRGKLSPELIRKIYSALRYDS
ncbi:MAG: hypothetical protein ILO68_04895 [Clostridia bacterium]|nr:hypothetical protein [Clostridia bacterium]